MAKNINHLQHVKSSVVENGLPKLPAPNVLVEGELAVNYATDKETISLKNSSGIVVTFSSDNYYSEKKLGSGFTGENSAVTVTQAIKDNERVVAAALTDLDERKLDASAYTQQDLSEYATKQWVDEERLGSGFTGENSGVTVTQAMNNTEKVVAAALNDLNERKLDASAYTPTDLSDYATKQWVDEERLGSGFTGENSGRTVTQVIEDDELAISAALNDLNDRKLDMSAYTPTDLSNYYDKDEIDDFLYDFGETLNGKASSITINNSTKTASNGNVNLGTVVSSMTVNGSAVTVTNGAAALTGLATASELLKYADKAEYNSSDKKIYFKNGNTTLTSMTIDATDFIKDGMVNEVKIDTPASGESSGVTCLIVTFNTDAGKEDIEIPLSRIFDSSLYYTKTEVDNVLGSGFTVSAVTSSVTDVIRENELIVASALNDLNSKKLDASAYTPTDLSDYYTRQEVNTMLGNDFIDFSGESFSSVTDIIRADETVMAAALNDLNDRKLDASAYTPSEFTDLVDEKLGYWFSGDSLSSVTDVIRENEIIVSSALNDLDSRKLDASAYTPTDLSDYATEEWVDERLGSGFTESSVTEVFNETEEVIAEALADLDSRISGNTTYINQVNSKADTIARSLSGYTPSGYSYSKSEVDVKLADKLDASAYTPTDLSGYYTKQEIDEDKLGSGFTGENSGKTVTQAINETEIVVAAALNDLDDRKLDASAYTPTDLSDYATKEWIENNVLGSGFTTGDYSGKSITEVIEENELIISSALNDLDERIDEISGSSSGGGSDANALSGVSVNGTPASVSNKVANITSVPASIVATSSTLNFVSSNEKSIWNGKQNALSNANVLTGITSQKVTNWDNASASAHSHSNKSVLDGITSTKVSNWDSAFTQAHTHDNKTILDNLTQAVIDNSHRHTNKTVLDGITTAKTAQWDNAISAVSFNGTDATVTNHKAAITATIPTSLSQLTSAHTHAISEVTNLQSTLNAKVSGITVNSGSKVTPTNGVANLTINASTVGALATGTTLDGIADGTTRKLSDYATTGTVNTHSGTTIPSATSSQMHLPAVTAADNGKILMVVNGQWALVNPTTIYTGTGTPSSSQGNDGDIYLQTS